MLLTHKKRKNRERFRGAFLYFFVCRFVYVSDLPAKRYPQKKRTTIWAVKMRRNMASG